MGNDGSALVIALITVGALILVTRWVFRPSRPRTGRSPDAADSHELGLLTVLAAGLEPRVAVEHQDRLGRAGVRSSTSRRTDRSVDLLVFAEDLDQARAILLL